VLSRNDPAAVRRAIAHWIVGVALLLAPVAASATDVVTNNYDAARTGANLSERILNPATVRSGKFGKLFDYHVDGPVMGQPLVVTGVAFPDGRTRDTLYITTASNSVYAFDADGEQATPLWQRQLNRFPDGRAAAPTGISSTPVIDRSTQTLYVVAGLDDGARRAFIVHALDLRSGADKMSGPALIQGSVRIGDQHIAFEPTATRIAVQRAALALAAGRLIVAFGGDFFEGWVFAIDPFDLGQPSSAFCTTCVSRVTAISRVDYLHDPCVFIGPGGGIWQAGRGPAVDRDGRVYFFTANKQHGLNRGCRIPAGSNACSQCAEPEGCVCVGARSTGVCAGPDTCIANEDRDSGAFDSNDALIVLDPRRNLQLAGWFRPENWNVGGEDGLEINDLDLGSSGPILLPGTDRVIGAGKQGVMYLLDTRLPAQGCKPGLQATCIAPQALQSFQVAPRPPEPNQYYRHVYGGAVLWPRTADLGGSRAYVWRVNDYLRSYRVSDRFEDCHADGAAPTTTHRCASLAQGTELIQSVPGGILTLSADGADPATAIVWASAYRTVRGPGRLMAFAAEPDPAHSEELPLLWDSDHCKEDGIESGSGFMPPTVANGKVYLAGDANSVAVYGLAEGKTCTEVPRVEGPGPLLQ